MKKFNTLDMAALVVWLLPVGYLVFIYPSLPASVPMHYGMNGHIDRYGSKTEFLFFQGLMLFIGLLVYLLLKFLPAIDPKKQVKYGEDTFQKMALGIVTFISALDIVILIATIHQQFRIDRMILPIVGLLFAFMGNVMHSIKPNYFASIRTPWTLESEATWRATHRLAGKLWFAGGIILSLATLILPATAATITFMAGVGILVIIPVVYSYLYFKKHPLNHN